MSVKPVPMNCHTCLTTNRTISLFRCHSHCGLDVPGDDLCGDDLDLAGPGDSVGPGSEPRGMVPCGHRRVRGSTGRILPVRTLLYHYYQCVQYYIITSSAYTIISLLAVRTVLYHYYQCVQYYIITTSADSTVSLLAVRTTLYHYYQCVHYYIITASAYNMISLLPVRTVIYHYYQCVQHYIITTSADSTVSLLPVRTALYHYYQCIQYCVITTSAYSTVSLLPVRTVLCSIQYYTTSRSECMFLIFNDQVFRLILFLH